MIKEKIKGTRSLSTVVGVSFAFLFFIFSFTGLFWTYISTNQFIVRQLSDTFEQKYSIAKNIFSHQQDLLQHSLRSIQNNNSFIDDVTEASGANTQKMLIKVVETALELPLDILFFTRPGGEIYADASSPFFNSQDFLPLLVDKTGGFAIDSDYYLLEHDTEKLAVLLSAIMIADPQTGKVLGTLFGGIVLNNNMYLFNKIKRETRSNEIFFLEEDNVISSTSRDKLLADVALKGAQDNLTSRLWVLLGGGTYSSNGLIFSKRMDLPREGNSNFEIVFSVPDTIFVDVRKSYLTISLLALFAVFVTLLVSIIVVRKLTIAPLQSLLRYSKAVASGDFGSSYQGGNIREFDQVGNAMEQMVHGLQSLNQRLQTDIAARMEAEKALKKSELHFRTLVENIPELVWLKDKDGVYLSCNPRFEKFYGASQEEIIGKTDYDFVDEEQADFFRMHDKNAMASNKLCINEEEITYASDGHKEHLETIKTPLVGDNGKLIGVLGIGRDISERKAAEKKRLELETQLRQAHKMEAIGTMAGGISHDFNNILAAILGYAEMARNEVPDDHPAKKSLLQVISASQRAKELIKHILTFSSMTSSTKGMKAVDLADIIKEVLDFQRSVIPSTISISSEMNDSVGLILGDSNQIHQILMNLSTNAAHAMEEQGGSLHVTVSEEICEDEDLHDDQHLASGNYAKLTVTDTGQGMTPQILDRIFDPYYTTKDIGKGTGMGLSVVLGIVKKHSGFMKVNSKPGVGSTFQLFFPITDIVREMPEKIEENSLPTGSEKILFVDDEEMLVDIGQKTLERLGYHVVAETDSAKALEIFREDPAYFDLVITDQTMPQLTGSELASELLALRPGIAILLCTGYSSNMGEAGTTEIGIKGFINKPVEISVMANIVRNTLDNR